MYIDIPKTPDQFVTSPIPIERSVAELTEKKSTKKRVATQALSEAMVHRPKIEMSKSDIEDVRNETIASKLVIKYKNKGGVEIISANTSSEIRNMFDSTENKNISPDHNIAILCQENSFPVLLEFRKPDSISFDMGIAVEAQSYIDPKIAKEQLRRVIEKHKKEGFIITKANIGMPYNSGDISINDIYKHIASELATIIETSKHIDDMHIEVTEYDTKELVTKSGVVFITEIDNGLHFTTTKINDEIIPPSYEYISRFV